MITLVSIQTFTLTATVSTDAGPQTISLPQNVLVSHGQTAADIKVTRVSDVTPGGSLILPTILTDRSVVFSSTAAQNASDVRTATFRVESVNPTLAAGYADITVTYTFIGSLTVIPDPASIYQLVQTILGSATITSNLNLTIIGGAPPYTTTVAVSSLVTPEGAALYYTILSNTLIQFSSSAIGQQTADRSVIFAITVTDSLGDVATILVPVEHYFDGTSDQFQGYLNRFTWEHRDRPKLQAMARVLLQGITATGSAMLKMPSLFDLNTAVGDQLDKTGEWVGISRQINLPVEGLFFSWDTDGVGWDQGIWFKTGDSTQQTILLADDPYRLLLGARVLNNVWDGSIPQAYQIGSTVFAATGAQLLVFDHGDLTMGLGLVSTMAQPDLVTLALFSNGYLDLKPAGVRVTEYLTPSSVGRAFGLDLDNAFFAGLDDGVWLIT